MPSRPYPPGHATMSPTRDLPTWHSPRNAPSGCGTHGQGVTAMNPYDDNPPSRHSRSPRPDWEADYPGGRDDYSGSRSGSGDSYSDDAYSGGSHSGGSHSGGSYPGEREAWREDPTTRSSGRASVGRASVGRASVPPPPNGNGGGNGGGN